MAELGLAKSGSPEKQASLFLSSGAVSCSVCLELVTDSGERSIAKLKCGHHFHLDCIGSAFNAKGSMQCPNCRFVEEGQWLYTNGSCHFEDYTVDDLSYQDDYEAGIADLFHLAEELDRSQRHWGPDASLSHQHASFSLENNPLAGGSQRVLHPGQVQVIDGNFGIPDLRELDVRMAGGSYVGESSARARRIPVSDRNFWSLHGTAPLASPNSGISTDHAEPSNLRHERVRRSRQASGNRFHGSYNLSFGQSRLHPRLSGSTVPNMAIFSHNQVVRDPARTTQNAASPAMRRGLNRTRRRLRVRGFQLASPNAQSSDLLYETGLGAPWSMTPGLNPIRVFDMDGALWNTSVEGFLGQTNENYVSPWGA